MLDQNGNFGHHLFIYFFNSLPDVNNVCGLQALKAYSIK